MGKTLSLVLSLFLLSPFMRISQVLADAEIQSDALKVRVGGGAMFLNRKSFRLIQTQNERAPFATQSVGEPFEYGLDGLGSSSNVLLERSLGDRFSLAAGFQATLLETKQTIHVPAGTNQAGADILNASVLPFLINVVSAENHDPVIEIGGKPNDPDATAPTNFAYDTQQYDAAFDVIYRDLVQVKDTQIDGIIGVGYTRINQNFDLHTEGVNVVNEAIVKTNTAEALRDNLYGGRVGIRTQSKVHPRVTAYGKAIAGFYADSIRYEGNQEFENVSFVKVNAPVLHSFKIVEVQHKDRFVPRLETEVGLACHFWKDWTGAIVYRFDALWEVSNVKHPEAIFENRGANISTDVFDGPVSIGAETLTQHYIEVKLSKTF